MKSQDLEEGDLVVLKMHTEGSMSTEESSLEDHQLLVTALVVDTVNTPFGKAEVEFVEPVPLMSALTGDMPDHLKEPGDEFLFGDTKMWVGEHGPKIVSHYRLPKTNE